MTIEELGREYLKKADEIMQKVKLLRTAAEKLPPEKRRKFNKRIKSLFTNAVECKQTALKLCDYYKFSKER